MEDKWAKRLLGELCNEVTVGFVGSMTQEYVDYGIPFLRSKNINEYEVNWNDMKFISTAFHNKLSKSALRPGDVAIVRTGKPGTTCVIPDELLDANCSDIVIARVKNDLLCPYYLSYFMNAMAHGQINAHIVGAVQQHFNVGSAKKIEIPLPPRSIQTQIVDILKVIDDKRQINQKTNQTLEQMAQALFKSWFVDFDPVFDNLLASVDFKLENLENRLPDELIQKAQRRLAALNRLENATECKASLSALAHELQAQTQAAVQVSEKAAETPVKANLNANPKILTQHANTHAHFPNEFEHNEQLGWIPKGWKQKYLSDLLEVKYGKDHKKLDDGKYPVYGSGGLMRYAESFLYEGESVLIPRKGTLSNIMHINGSFWTVDTMFYTIPKVPKVVKFMFYHLKALDFAAMNVGSAVPSMTTKVLNSLELLFPSVEVLYRFDKVIEDYFNKIDFNKLNINQLESLRNTLLPKLISGELQIPDVAIDEEIVD